MPRIARVVAPDIPHHITQRGNRRQQTFFCDDDYRLYLDLLAQWCGALEQGLGEELLAVDLERVLLALGDIVGVTTPDDLLNRIFAEFCIGK